MAASWLEKYVTGALSALAGPIETLRKSMHWLATQVGDLQPQMGQTEALAEHVKRQVKLLAAKRKIARVLSSR